ncbi:MAG: ABC transporter permease [Acidobacteriota bacterium]
MIGRWLYRCLLLLYPPRLRDGARAEMEPLFVDLRADARRRGRLAALAFTVRAFAEVPRRGLAARRQAGAAENHTATTSASFLPTRSGSTATMLDRLFNDLRHALRALRHEPGFVAVVVLTLAVGIGANTAIFSVVEGVLLDALPYAAPERIVGIWQYSLQSGGRSRMTPGNFLDVRALDDVFDSAAAFGFASATLIVDGEPELVRGGRVSADYLRVLGVRPLLGRGFRADDEDVGGPSIAMIGEELWRRRFAADPTVVGSTVNLDGTPFEVIGILPRGVYPTSAAVDGELSLTPDNHDFLLPLRFTAEFYASRRSHILGAIARLADGVSVAQADAAVDALAAAVREQDPIVAGEGFTATPLRDEIIGPGHNALWVLMGTVALVLLIATSNVAGLMLARADGRRTETAVRVALGAGRATLVRQSVIESLLLAVAGAAAGVVLAYMTLDAIKRMVPFQIPRMNEVTLDSGALLFAVVAALLVGVVLGIAPVALASREGALARLRQGARGLTADGTRRQAQSLLVAVQACMAVLLVVGAGLLVRTFLHIKRIDPGFAAGGTVAVPLSLPPARYLTAADTLRFFDDIERSLTAVPGVARVAFGYDHPLRKNWGDSFRIEGAPPLEAGQAQGASFRPVSPGYFETVGIPLLRGRTFVPTDDVDHPAVVVINEAFARQYFPDDQAVGKRIRIPTVESMFGDGSEQWMEIAGVVGDVRFNGLTAAVEPAMYVSLRQVPLGDFVLLVAPARAGVDLFGAVRNAVRGIDAELPVDGVRTLDTLRDDSVARERFNMLLVGLFAALALALAGLGIYGLIARLVQTQFKEIGIRVALGAQRGGILRLVLTGALLPVLLGGIAGLAAAAGLSRLLGSLLYEVGALDPATFVATPVVLAATALLAGWLPARRATRIDPIVALRD